MRYSHTQQAPLFLVLLAFGIGSMVGVWFIPDRAGQLVLASVSLLFAVLAASFRELTVKDCDDHLLVSFGPLPLFRRRIAYANMQRAERSRTTVFDGWGIHLSPSGGWTWNLWGFDCVDVYLNRGRKVRIGTDDPAGLEAFLKEHVVSTRESGEGQVRIR